YLLSGSLEMFFENAAVHDNVESCRGSPLRGGLIDHAFLKPHGVSADSYRFVNVSAGFVASAEYVDQVNFLRNFFQACVCSFTQDGSLVGIDRNDTKAVALHIPRDAVTRTRRVGRQTDYSDGSIALENSAYAVFNVITH